MIGSLLRLAPAALTTSLLLLVGAPAAAEQPTPTPADAAQVNQHYETGLESAKQSQWLQARESFLRAWRLKAHYQIAANLGRAELMTGAHRDAAEHLAYFLREAPADLNAQDRAQAQQWLDEAKAKIGTISIKVEPPDAEVLLDGTRLPAPLPAEVYVEPGKRVLEIRRQGHANARRELDLSPGQAQAVDIALTPEPPPVPPPRLPPPAPLRPVLIGVGLGATVTMATGGAALMVMAALRAGKQRDLCPDRTSASCAEGTSEEWVTLERSRIDALNLGIGSFIGAAILGGATAAYALTGGGAAAPARSGRVRVHVVPGGAGLSGHF